MGIPKNYTRFLLKSWSLVPNKLTTEDEEKEDAEYQMEFTLEETCEVRELLFW